MCIHRAIGRSENSSGRVVIQNILKETFLFLFLPRPGEQICWSWGKIPPCPPPPPAPGSVGPGNSPNCSHNNLYFSHVVIYTYVWNWNQQSDFEFSFFMQKYFHVTFSKLKWKHITFILTLHGSASFWNTQDTLPNNRLSIINGQIW